MHSMFDWEDLRHFAALARDKSLSAAARRLMVDHATVARRVAALEAALELKLVDRRPRTYALTADGERIAELAARMEEEAFALGRAARASKPGLTGEVAISAPPTLATTLIAPWLGPLRRRHPGICIRLDGEKRSASLLRREADIAVRLFRPSEKNLVVRKVGRLVFALYAAPAYLAEHRPADYAFIGYDDALAHLPQQHWLKALVGSRPIVARISDLDGHRMAARAGVGLAALPTYLGDADAGLARVAVRTRPATREVWLAVHSDLRRVPAVQAVMAFLGERFAEEPLRSAT
jgi:DNA-binding transcriptional LysR family regulator